MRSQLYSFILHVSAAATKAFKQFDKKDEEMIRVSDIQSAMSAMGVRCKADWLESIEDTLDESGTRAPSVVYVISEDTLDESGTCAERRLRHHRGHARRIRYVRRVSPTSSHIVDKYVYFS